jgi:hypothetical protein
MTIRVTPSAFQFYLGPRRYYLDPTIARHGTKPEGLCGRCRTPSTDRALHYIAVRCGTRRLLSGIAKCSQRDIERRTFVQIGATRRLLLGIGFALEKERLDVLVSSQTGFSAKAPLIFKPPSTKASTARLS